MYVINGKSYSWDPEKSRANFNKHGIKFKSAATSFDDPNRLKFYDENHSHDEDRFILIGINSKDKLLTVSYCLRYNDEVTRIISARKANKSEQNMYGGAL